MELKNTHFLHLLHLFLLTIGNNKASPDALASGEVGNSLANWSEGAAFPIAQVMILQRIACHKHPLQPLSLIRDSSL